MGKTFSKRKNREKEQKTMAEEMNQEAKKPRMEDGIMSIPLVSREIRQSKDGVGEKCKQRKLYGQPHLRKSSHS